MFRRADVVHVRCPANIALLAVVMLPLFRRRHARWIKYGGNWNPGHDDPPAYRFQRWWLRHGPLSARVTVNGPLPGDPSHVHHFLNPCLTEQELAEGREAAREKRMDSPLRLLYVGGIEPAKGSIRTIRILAAVVERGIDAALDVVGDGPGRADAEKLAAELGVADRARFHGWAPRSEIPGFLRGGHILLLPSDSEGWPKVLSEAMAYGVIPIASDVSSIKQVLAECGAGVAVALNDISGYADAVCAYALDSERWRREVRDGALAAERFGYTEYLSRVRRLLDLPEPERDPTHSIAAAEPAPTR